MPGSMVSSEGAASFGDPVEVVQGDRIRPKAIYRSRQFRLLSVDSTRYRWRCTVSNCSSRLMTDKFDEKHVLYSFKEHDENEHRAAEERRHFDKTFKSQVVKKVGEFLYVPEKTVGEIKCWRCRYVSCSGRCRTSLDGKQLLHGPTAHTCQSFTREEQARPPHDQPLSSQHTPIGLSQGVAGTSTDASEHQREQRSASFDINSDDDTLDEDELSRRGDDEYNDAEGHLRSRLRYGQNNMSSSRSAANSAQALEMMSSSCTCAEQKLRVTIYQQISAVLSMEADLLREQMRNEVRRGRLLVSQIKKGPSAAE